MIKVNVYTKVLKLNMFMEVDTTDKAIIERKLKKLMELTGGKIYICDKCGEVHLTDEPLKEVYITRTGGMLSMCEDCCTEAGIFDVEILQYDLKKLNARYISLD